MKKKYYWIIGIVILILILILFLMSSISPRGVGYSLESVSISACQTLVKTGCNSNTNSISLEGFDANKDEKVDSSDTLFALCQNYYGITSEANCKELCGCSLCSQDNSLLCNRSCNSDNDCELSCGCGCISKSEECKYAGIVCEAPGPYEECKCVNNECKYFNPPP